MKVRFPENMKASALLVISIAAPFVMIFLYVWLTASQVVFRDDIYLIKGGWVESYCNGTLAFSAFWRPAASTRIPGYNFLQFINIKVFGMNSKLIALSIPFLVLGSVLMIYRDYRKCFAPRRSSGFIALSFLFVSLLMFNIIQWEGLTFSYAFVFQSPLPFFIASVICFERILTKGTPGYVAAGLLLSALSVLVFGGTHSYSFAWALGLTFVCYAGTRRDRMTKEVWLRALGVSAYLGVLAVLYMYNIRHNDYFPHATHHVDKMIAQPLAALQFLLAAFGASVVGVNAAKMYFPFSGMVFLGSLVVCLYGLALFLYFRFRLYERSYLPFYLLMQAFFYLVFMTAGRFGYGIDYGMASRYTCVSVLGLVGSGWVLIYVLAGGRTRRTGAVNLLVVPLMVIAAGLILTAMTEWRIQPHRKVYFENLREIALRVDSASDEELAKFEERPALVRESLRVLKECHLNVYHQPSIVRRSGSPGKQ